MMRSRWLAALFGIFVLASLVLLRAADPFAVRAIRDLAFDQFQRLTPRQSEQMPVRVADIDEASLQAYGQWPWPRDRMAELVKKLDALGAATIVFDIAFAEPDRLSPSRVLTRSEIEALVGGGHGDEARSKLPDTDHIFSQAIGASRVVLAFGITKDIGVPSPKLKAGIAFTGNATLDALPRFRVVTPIVPELEAAATGIGTMSLSPGESSGAIRQLPLLLTDGKQAFPSLTLEALRVAQDASTFIIRGASDRDATIEDIRIGDYVVPTTENGELWLYYRPESRDLYVSVKDILEGTEEARLRNRLEGHIVLVGTSATGLFDLRSTALGETVPGVAMHAQALEQILAGTYLWRPDWSYGAEILAIVLMGLLIIAATLLLGPLSSFAIGAIAAVLVAAGTWALFRSFGLLLDPSFVLFSGFVIHLCMTAYRFLITDRTARAVSRAFAHYVSPPVLAQIQKQPDDLKLGGEVRPLTIMFLDIRNFTPISENLSPEELIAFLNRLLGDVSRCIVEEDGTIDKYIGDSVMAFWNAPVAVPDHPRRACIAALRMREVASRLNRENAFGFAGRGFAFEKVGIGVGLNTGPACVGNMGSEERFNYSCVGDAVNLAARVESACKEVGFDLVVAGATADAVPDLALLYAGAVPLKGKSQHQPLYLLAGDVEMRLSEAFATLAALHLSFVEALGRGDDQEAERLADRCREASAGLVPLDDFYAKAFQRLDDFRPAPAETPAAEAAE